MENKMTKKEKFALAAELLADNAELVEFFNDEIAKLDAKAEKAKVRAAEKRAEGDELYKAVIACVGSEPMTREAVFEAMGDEELTVAKVGARLSQGVKNGELVKSTEKVDGKNKVVYTKAE